MSDKRFTCYYERGNEVVIEDNGKRLSNKQLVDLLNELETKCHKLKEENDKLKGLIKGNVFGMYGEGSLADLEFKAIAYDDIVKLEMSNDSEPKVIVVCKQGKKENVKSFCQMFIPFGIYYEIREIVG